MSDLANECSHFVTGYFEIISTSSPHIYHSALVVAPTNSTLRKIYQSHIHPFVRVIHGAPASWDTNSAAMTGPSVVHSAVWSPCNRFIAVSYQYSTTVDILDSATLQQLQTFICPEHFYSSPSTLAFSPDGRLLTYSNGIHGDLFVVSWDLQTGGVIGIVKEDRSRLFHVEIPSITHSADGKMVGVSRLCRDKYYNFLSGPTISIFDVASGMCVYSHSVSSGFPLPGGIWVQGDSLRFATSVETTITIWEVGFTSHDAPVVVEMLPAPDKFDCLEHNTVQFLPVICRLALNFRDKVLVWDVRNSKYLLYFTDARLLPKMTFSSDGRFFACGTPRLDIYLWRESPTGYVLHKILSPSTEYSSLLLSHNGESIVVFSCTTWLWHTKCSTAPPSNALVQARHTGVFLLDFSPDRMLAVVVMQRGETVMILDLESGVLRSTINAGMRVFGLRVAGSAVILIGDKRVARWELPMEGCASTNPGVELEGHSWIVGYLSQVRGKIEVSISPDLRCTVSIVGSDLMYSAYQGTGFLHKRTSGIVPWFTPDGKGLWCADGKDVMEEWKVGDDGPVRSGLKWLCGWEGVTPRDPPAGYPWGSSRGYQVTKDWWVHGPDGKRLLRLPPHWQSAAVHRMWKGQFLALLHPGLPEPVILELLSP